MSTSPHHKLATSSTEANHNCQSREGGPTLSSLTTQAFTQSPQGNLHLIYSQHTLDNKASISLQNFSGLVTSMWQVIDVSRRRHHYAHTASRRATVSEGKAAELGAPPASLFSSLLNTVMSSSKNRRKRRNFALMTEKQGSASVHDQILASSG